MFAHLKKKRQGNSGSRSRGPTYEPLRESAEEEHYEQKVPGESKRFLIWGSILGILVLCTVGFSLVTVSTSSLEPYAYERYDPRTKRCGDTAEQAKRRGCRFDPITFSWLPMDCVDHELIDEFHTTNWTLYADKNKTETRTEEEWSNGTGKMKQAWLTNEDRRLHCIYSWKRMHRAIMLGKSLPTGISSYAETELCAGALAAQVPSDEIAFEIRVEFPAC